MHRLAGPDVVEDAAAEKVIGLRNNSTATRRGSLTAYDNKDVCAFTKTSGPDSVFVLVNLRNTPVTYPVAAALQHTSWSDAFDGSGVTVGTQLTLPAYGYKVLKK